MNVLILSTTELDAKNASGNTYANFFSQWENTKFACVYARSSYPDNDFCDEYYRITISGIIKNFFTPWRIGDRFAKRDIQQLTLQKNNVEKKIEKKYRGKRNFLYLIYDFLYYLSFWKNKKYKDFIKDFKPDIVFFSAKSDAFYYENLKYIKKYTQARIVAFYTDDVFGGYVNNKGLVRKIFARRFPKIVGFADFHYGASLLMCESYGKLFDIKIKPLYKGCEISDPSVSLNNPIKMVYAGNLFYGRDEVLCLVAKALENINQKFIKIILEIYTGSSVPPDIEATLNNKEFTKIVGQKPYCEIKKILHSADIVLHVESFKQMYIDKVKLSYSTKISDCLQSGSMLLVVGPKGVSSVEESLSIEGSCVITEPSCIEEELNRMLLDKSLILSNAKKTNNYAKEKFPLDLVRRDLKNDFLNLCCENPQKMKTQK
ncbi:MAG: hypothetical protein J6I79_05080 [Paludibacteraceae bacterium]|nr:hypothetical protein [Paludibacteraceae bacterium]